MINYEVGVEIKHKCRVEKVDQVFFSDYEFLSRRTDGIINRQHFCSHSTGVGRASCDT
jgi:hypothetical protein